MIDKKYKHGSNRAKQVIVFAVFSAVSIIGASGCVNIAAPEKPIEINLNINIRQEVLVRLERDVQDLITKNPGVF